MGGGNGVLRGGRASRVAREGDVRGGKREGALGMPHKTMVVEGRQG